jgi:hypothetical protein
MRPNTRLPLRLLIVFLFLVVDLSGCSQADNPKMAKAPPPGPPTREEVEPAKGDRKKMDPSKNSRYMKAMENMGKQFQR